MSTNARIMDDGIEPTPRNMITITKLFESKLVMICDEIKSKLELKSRWGRISSAKKYLEIKQAKISNLERELHKSQSRNGQLQK